MNAVYVLLIWTLGAKQPTEFGHYDTAKECLEAAREADVKYENAHSGETHVTRDTWTSIECRLGVVPKSEG